MRFPKGPIRAKTKDGEDVELQATLVLRVSEQNATQLVRFLGADVSSLLDLYLIPGARSVIRTVFGELDSASFLDAAERRAKSQKCLSALNELLSDAGVAVESFSLDHFAFDQEFHTYLQDMKILGQRIASVDGQREATLEQLRQELERTKATARLTIAAVQRRLEFAKTDAEATIERMKQKAEMVRQRLSREADLARERASAMSGPGGELAIRLELARALKGKPIVILPDDAAGLGGSFSELSKMLSEPQVVGRR